MKLRLRLNTSLESEVIRDRPCAYLMQFFRYVFLVLVCGFMNSRLDRFVDVMHF